MHPVYANYIGPSVMTDANCEGFPICDDRITENDRCVIKIIGIHCASMKIQGKMPDWQDASCYLCFISESRNV